MNILTLSWQLWPPTPLSVIRYRFPSLPILRHTDLPVLHIYQACSLFGAFVLFNSSSWRSFFQISKQSVPFLHFLLRRNSTVEAVFEHLCVIVTYPPFLLYSFTLVMALIITWHINIFLLLQLQQNFHEIKDFTHWCNWNSVSTIEWMNPCRVLESC